MAARGSRRRWLGLRPAAPEPETVVDLREPPPVVLRDDVETVLAKLGQLRDAGLITAAEYETEKQRIREAWRGAPPA